MSLQPLEELHDDASSEADESSMSPYSNAGARSRLTLGWCVWTVASSLSLVSSKYILVNRNYHYPLHLLLSHLLLAALGSTCRTLRYRGRLSVAFSAPHWKVLWNNRKLKGLFELVAIALAAASLPLVMQAVLHFWNLTTLCMIAATAMLTEAVILAPMASSPMSLRYLSEIAVASFALASLLYDEYRLSVNGLLFGIPALALAGASRALFHVNGVRNDLQASNAHAGPNFTFQLMIWVAFALTAPWALLVEDFWGAIFDLLKINPIWMVFNTVTSAVALVSGGSVLFRLPVHPPSSGGKAASFVARSILIGPSLAANTAIVALVSTLLVGHSYTSSIQLIAYLIALIAAASVSSSVFKKLDENDTLEGAQHEMLLHGNLSESTPRLQSPPPNGVVGLAKEALGDRLAFSLALALVVLSAGCLCAWLPINFGIIERPHGQRNLPLHLDNKYRPASDVDIVVSMYKEPVDYLNSVLDSLKRIPALSNAKKQRLIIYVKDEEVSTETIRQKTDAFNVTRIPNVGREGETYLRHILEHWDDFARHTMFIQADIHNPREFIPRVEEYFDPASTGMLSLGFSGNVCDCSDCGDRFSWHDDTNLISSLYKDVYQTDKTCSRALLSYKGQFIASARRIRGVEKKIYEDLWKALVDPDSWAHSQEYLRGRYDEMSAPFFGYTLERVWSILMQCSDMEVAWKCPTLLSGTRRGGSKADCQCFDEVDSSD